MNRKVHTCVCAMLSTMKAKKTSNEFSMYVLITVVGYVYILSHYINSIRTYVRCVYFDVYTYVVCILMYIRTLCVF